MKVIKVHFSYKKAEPFPIRVEISNPNTKDLYVCKRGMPNDGVKSCWTIRSDEGACPYNGKKARRLPAVKSSSAWVLIKAEGKMEFDTTPPYQMNGKEFWIELNRKNVNVTEDNDVIGGSIQGIRSVALEITSERL